jgi:hypothetical protein
MAILFESSISELANPTAFTNLSRISIAQRVVYHFDQSLRNFLRILNESIIDT